MPRLALGLLAASAAGCLSAREAPHPRPAASLPPLAAPYPVPPLPATSARIASYTMEARLFPERHAIDGSLLLEWRNESGQPLSTFPFHLYWNAFRNNLSTTARGEGRRVPRQGADGRGYGWIHVTRVEALSPGPADLTPSLRYLTPDGNAEDRTVMQVETPQPVPPGAVARFRVDWTSLIPFGDVGRAGWVHDYHFIAQWFPKIGVHWKGAWNAHQYHPWTEFFSDFGVYDVRLTLPAGFVVGATGRLQERLANADGSETFRFVQEDVHDFAWTASRRFREREARFEDPGHPPVAIRLLVQPEKEHLAERYIEATRIALRSYAAWSAPYPYAQVTVVDPPWRSNSGGMEYPTLFTGGAGIWSPKELRSPESVTIHEAGHQFWYGLVANNEFEEAWLDEGVNDYHEEKALQLFLGPRGWGKRYFGLRAPPRGARLAGWPVVARGVQIGRGENDLSDLRRHGRRDAMNRPGWGYHTSSSYTINSYGKPALSLQTLEGLVGDETMTRIMRTYARRYWFSHPTSADFIAVVNEVTGSDWSWFFEQTWFSDELCDYAVEVKNALVRQPAGWTEGPDGRPVPVPSPVERGQQADGPWEAEVAIRRLGEVRLPVELEVELVDGRRVRESWDGQYRWARFRYPARVRRAVVDPERKIALDVNPANNAWVDDEDAARRASWRWALRWLLWLQNLLELHTAVG